jgi:hypothetical protein
VCVCGGGGLQTLSLTISEEPFARKMEWNRWTNSVAPRSPDLTPLDFFFLGGGEVCIHVYVTPLRLFWEVCMYV